MNASTLDPSVLLRNACDAVLHLVPDALAVYVFGSFADASERADSDLDIAVLGERPLDPLRRMELQRQLGARLDRDVDFVDLRTASAVLSQEVLARGRILFKRDDARVLDFEARALGEYAALMDATRALRESARERGRVHAR